MFTDIQMQNAVRIWAELKIVEKFQWIPMNHVHTNDVDQLTIFSSYDGRPSHGTSLDISYRISIKNRISSYIIIIGGLSLPIESVSPRWCVCVCVCVAEVNRNCLGNWQKCNKTSSLERRRERERCLVFGTSIEWTHVPQIAPGVPCARIPLKQHIPIHVALLLLQQYSWRIYVCYNSCCFAAFSSTLLSSI